MVVFVIYERLESCKHELESLLRSFIRVKSMLYYVRRQFPSIQTDNLKNKVCIGRCTVLLYITGLCNGIYSQIGRID